MGVEFPLLWHKHFSLEKLPSQSFVHSSLTSSLLQSSAVGTLLLDFNQKYSRQIYIKLLTPSSFREMADNDETRRIKASFIWQYFYSTVFGSTNTFKMSMGQLTVFWSCCVNNKKLFWAGALVYWLWEETHVLKVVGSNPSTAYCEVIKTILFSVYSSIPIGSFS